MEGGSKCAAKAASGIGPLNSASLASDGSSEGDARHGESVGGGAKRFAIRGGRIFSFIPGGPFLPKLPILPALCSLFTKDMVFFKALLGPAGWASGPRFCA